MQKLKKNNRIYFEFELFKQFPQLTAFVTTRSCGNLVLNKDEVLSDWSINSSKLVTAEQVHGANVSHVTDAKITLADNSKQIAQTDGLIGVRNLASMILTADCAPVFIFDPKNQLTCLIHAGWRGLHKRIITQAVQKLQQEFGSNPEELFVAVGPLLAKSDYQVRQDLVEAFGQSHGQTAKNFFSQHQGKIFFDLEKAILFDLEKTGIKPTQTEVSGVSTGQSLEHFYSHRVEKGKTGRFASLMLII